VHVIARSGTQRVLLYIGEDTCRVLDQKRRVLFPPISLRRLLGRGSWQPYRVSDAELQTLLARLLTR
jgi:hypothetical protein